MGNVIPVERKVVNFNGAELAAIKADNGKIYAGVSWICNGLGFDKNHKDRQVKNIQSDLVLKQGCVKFDAGVFDPNNEVLAIELDFLPLWLAKISITPKMQEETPWIARMLVEYQLKAKEVLAQAFIQKQPQTQLEVLQMAINQMVAQEQRVNQIEQNQVRLEQNNHLLHQENKVLKTRIDNLDQVNIEGSPRQQFTKMINLYAHKNGGQYSKAWKEFIQHFNTAFRTNLELRRQNHINKIGKDISRPQFLEETGLLEDAIRVADKMLNQRIVN